MSGLLETLPPGARGIDNKNFFEVGRVVPTARTPRGRVQSADYPGGENYHHDNMGDHL